MSLGRTLRFIFLVSYASRPLFVSAYCRPLSSNTFRTGGFRMSSSFRNGFFDLPMFAVVGASADRDKFGNKVLRCYKQHGKQAIPISKRQANIESLPCKESLTALSTQHDVDMAQVGVSIITPPGVTAMILQEGVSLGCRHFYLQPGTADATVRELIESEDFVQKGVKVIQGCVLVDLGFSDI